MHRAANSARKRQSAINATPDWFCRAALSSLLLRRLRYMDGKSFGTCKLFSTIVKFIILMTERTIKCVFQTCNLRHCMRHNRQPITARPQQKSTRGTMSTSRVWYLLFLQITTRYRNFSSSYLSSLLRPQPVFLNNFSRCFSHVAAANSFFIL